MRQQSNTSISSDVKKCNRLILGVTIILAFVLISLAVTTLIFVVKIDKRESTLQLEPLTTTPMTIEKENTTSVLPITDRTTYHFIVVGCGTSGAVLASRLSENPHFRVICIEKGPRDLPNEAEWSAMKIPNDFNFISPHDPVIITTRQQSLNKLVYIPRSMGLGGTSRIYGMINARASPDMLKEWPEGWQYEHFLPYYKKLEDHYCHHMLTNISTEDCELYHGKSGPMQVNSLDSLLFHNVSQAFREICYDTNQPWNGYSTDYNGDLINRPHSCSMFEQFKYRPSGTSSWFRGSSKTGYLTTEVLKRPNLSIVVDSTVTRIIFDDTARAIGVEYYDTSSHTVKRITALYEVILAAGAFATPHLLQVSGIGDPDHLQTINVSLVANNTHVGKYLADHISLPYIVQLHDCDETFNDMNGPFSWLVQFNSGVRTNQSKNIRDIQIYVLDASDGRFTHASRFCSEIKADRCGVSKPGTIATLRITLQNTDFSSGTVKAPTNSIFDKPEIDLNWTKLSDNDRNTFLMAVHLLRSYTLNKSSEFGQLIAGEILPGPLTFDEYFKFMESALHPTCSCRMGFCTDKELLVRGTTSLRVCDASSFGSQIDANPSATIYAMAEMLSDKLKRQYTSQHRVGTWKTRQSMLVFESDGIVSCSKIAAFDLEGTLIHTNPNNVSNWYLFNSFVRSRLQHLHSDGYKIVIFTDQANVTSKLEFQLQWQSKIEMIATALKVPIQLFSSTTNDDYRTPRVAMWRDFTWLFNDGINIDYKASFYVSKYRRENFSDVHIQFAANIPLAYYSSDQQFTNASSYPTVRHFNIIQTVRISNTAEVVWKLIGGFFSIHKWHPQISACEKVDDPQQLFVKRRLVFFGQIIETIEQLQVLDNYKREYQYKNIGGRWGKAVQNYASKLSVMEDDNGRSVIVSWSASFDSQTDIVTTFYRTGLDALVELLSSPLMCSSYTGNNFKEKLFSRKDQANPSIYWRQEYNINASELWKHIDTQNRVLNDQLPKSHGSLLSYDRDNYELTYCTSTSTSQSSFVTKYISMEKVISTDSTSSAWIRTGYIISMTNDRSVDDFANHILENIFVAEGDKLRQQLSKLNT
ncbi:unnamed protein product [Adineta ricciae]|uniref:Glucose-methanol-choline oxidoreductase N-terminal domain-containing protein n=1 Tax=Adineta ricciae TaxID=249248 RepID=A0A815J7Q6_ADIRI|nr:unnamed protein product [Adineta ricciae]